MASSSILMKRAASPSLLKRLINSNNNILRSVSATRSFNTNAAAQVSNYDDNRNYDVDRRSVSSATRRRDADLFSDVFDPFVPTRSLSQVLNLMDQFMDNPFLTASRGIGAGSRRSWDVKEKEDALYLRMDMPGLGKEDVKVSMEQNTLTIRGEGKNAEGDDEEEVSGRRFSSRIDLPPKLYRVDQIKAEMKNGVLKVVVPKVKEEERKDVYQINVE